jgi:hypothetical protein
MVVRSPVRSPVRSVVRSVLGGFGGAVSAETLDELVASLLSAGETVAFYDPNDLTSVYTARTGGANAVADGPVGLMLDKAQMGGLTAAEYLAALDTPELVTNGDFATDSDWTKGVGWTISEGVASYDATLGYTLLSQNLGLSQNKLYKITFDIIGTIAAVRLGGQTTPSSVASNITTGSISIVGRCIGSDATFYLVSDSGVAATIDNVSVVELPGYHAVAPSDAARPILRDVSSTYALDFDQVDDAFAWTTPAITDGTWVALTRDGSYAASAAYSAGTYTMPIWQPFDLCAILWTSADLTTVQEAIVLAEGSARGAAADFGGVTNFTNGWRVRSDLRDFPVIDTSGGTNFFAAWAISGLTTFPLLDVSSGTNFQAAWYQCTSLTSFPALNVSSGTNFQSAWRECTSLTSFPALNVSSGTDFRYTWYQCNGITSFPALDVSSGTNFSETWRFCSGLTSFPLLDVSSGTNFQQAWQGCTNLADFPANMFDSVTATNFGDAFATTNLTQTSIDNILVSINTANTSGGTFNQFGGSAPSATGEAAIDALRGRGWTVTVTGGY